MRGRDDRSGWTSDLQTLEDISKMTGGKSYLAETEGSLKEILDDIQKLEKTKIIIHPISLTLQNCKHLAADSVAVVSKYPDSVHSPATKQSTST